MKLVSRIVVSVVIVLQLAGTTGPAYALEQHPQIAITFDDAPVRVTPLLSTLQQKEAVATFFLVGTDTAAHPELAQSLAAAGMLIGNHSHDHAHFAEASSEEIRSNLTQAQETIASVTGVTPRWFRSPYLDSSPYYATVLPQLGLTASWPSINPKDWAGVTPESIVGTITAQARPGSVVILHDMTSRTNTIEALPDVIDGLREQGYELCTLDDLALGHIEGVVSGDGGEPLQAATVVVYDQAARARGTASTDMDGRFRVARLAPGLYRVGVTRQGNVDGFYGGSSTLSRATEVAVTSNYTTDGVTVTLQRDVEAPETTLADVPSGWTSGPVTVSLSARDDFSAASMQTWYRLGSDAPMRYTSPVRVDRQGETSLGFWSTDSAGNVEATHVVCLRIDISKPTTVVSRVESQPGSTHVTLDARDSLSGIAVTNYRLDALPAVAGTMVGSDVLGRHTLRYWSVDRVGNREDEKMTSFAVVAPTRLTLQTVRHPRVGRRDTDTATVGLTATLRRADSGGRLSGQRVQLQRRTTSASSWRTVASAHTAVDGRARFKVAARRGYRYRVTYAGLTDMYRSSSSASSIPLPKTASRR